MSARKPVDWGARAERVQKLGERVSRVGNVAIHRLANKLEGLTPQQAFERDCAALALKYAVELDVNATAAEPVTITAPGIDEDQLADLIRELEAAAINAGWSYDGFTAIGELDGIEGGGVN